MRSQLRILLPLLVIGLILIALPFAETLWKRYNPVTGAWPGSEITYFNASEYDVSLRAAFRRWEEVGLPLRFRETGDRNGADLVVFSGEKGLRENCNSPQCTGWATLGHTPFRQAEMWLLPPTNPYEDEIQDFVMMPTIIHETGHVLGLGHSDEPCSIMSVRLDACRSLARSRISNEGRTMLCGPWESDLDNLRELYPEVGTSFSGFCKDPRATWDFFASQRAESFEISLHNFHESYNR